MSYKNLERSVGGELRQFTDMKVCEWEFGIGSR